MKDWAEILLTQKKYDEAEEKIRKVLELLEEKDSDALFSLGVILSEAGKDEESIEAYTKSVKLNAEEMRQNRTLTTRTRNKSWRLYF